MTETKFTPGSWAVGGDGLRIKPLPFGMFFQPIANLAPVIEWDANGGWIHHDESVAKANAHLMAQSPDFYEISEVHERRLRDCARNIQDEFPLWSKDLEKMAAALSELLAKARGEQS